MAEKPEENTKKDHKPGPKKEKSVIAKKPISLQTAVTKADEEAVTELLQTSQKGNELSEPINSVQTTLIHLAAEKGETHKNILNLLVQHRVLRLGDLDLLASGAYTPLHHATRSGSKESVEILIRNGAFLSAKDKFGNTPLHIAVEASDPDLVALLLKYGAATHVKNKDKKTPFVVARSRANNYTKRDETTLNTFQREQMKKCLEILQIFEKTSKNRYLDPKKNIFYAASTGNCDLIKEVLQENAEMVINTISNNGYSPLFYAVKNNHLEAVELLLKLGANPRVQNNFATTPLHKSIENKNLNIFATLLAHNTSVNLRDRQGKLPLDLAVSTSQWEFVSALIEKHTEEIIEGGGFFVKSVVQKFNHVLRQATKEGELCVAANLLKTKYAVDVNERTASGWNVLHLAIKNQKLELVKLFLQYKVDVNSVIAEGFTALHMAAELPLEDSSKLPYISALIEAKANTNAVTLSGYTPLHMLVKKGNTACVRALLKQGHADPNISHPLLSIPYYTAIKSKFYDIVELLIQHGSIINQSTNKKSNEVTTAGTVPLLHAIRCGRDGIAEQMVGQGMDINVQGDTSGWTALGLAVLKDSDFSLFEKLLDAGANVNSKNAFGFTALHSACTVENERVVGLLLERKADPNIPNSKEFYPLHTALTLKNANIVRLLLRAGADTTRPFPTSGTLPTAVIGKIDNLELIEEFLHQNSDVDPAIRLCTAIRSGQTNLVKFLIEEKGMNLNKEYHDASFNDLRRPLSYTIKKNNTVDLPMIKYLISRGANPSLPLSSSSGRNLIHMAVDMNNQSLFNYLMGLSENEPLDLNLQEKNRWTALGVALGGKKIEMAMKLIESGADVNLVNDKNISPLHQAVTLNSQSLVDAILAKGGDVNALSFHKMTPLDIALRAKHWGIARTLIEKGANHLKKRVGHSSWSLLHYIASLRGVDNFIVSEAIRLMISQSEEFSINDQDKNGWTPVHLAVRNFNRHAVDVLVQAGADVTLMNNQKWAPLHTLARMRIKPPPKSAKGKLSVFAENLIHICNVLIDALQGTPRDQGIDQKGENGYTPLDIANFNSNRTISQKLLENGAKSSTTSTKWGIHNAAEAGNSIMIRNLAAESSEVVNKKKGAKGWTPLHVASWFGHDKAVQSLIELKADITIQDKEGKTALHLAVQKRRVRVIKALFNGSPQKEQLGNIKDKSGVSVAENISKYDPAITTLLEGILKPKVPTTPAARGRGRGRLPPPSRRGGRGRGEGRVPRPPLLQRERGRGRGRGRGNWGSAEEWPPLPPAVAPAEWGEPTFDQAEWSQPTVDPAEWTIEQPINGW